MDAGVAPIDIETRKRKEEIKAREAQTRAVTEHGELALITVDSPQVTANERISLRPPMLQVVYKISTIFQYLLNLMLEFLFLSLFCIKCSSSIWNFLSIILGIVHLDIDRRFKRMHNVHSKPS